MAFGREGKSRQNGQLDQDWGAKAGRRWLLRHEGFSQLFTTGFAVEYFTRSEVTSVELLAGC